MASVETPTILHLVLIAGRKQKDKLLAALAGHGGHIINVYYGTGAAKTSYLSETLGLVHEEQKVLISCLASKTEADAIFGMLLTEFRFDKPNTGVAYSIPVEKLSY